MRVSGLFLTGLQRNPIGHATALPQLPAPCAPCCRVEAISSLLEARQGRSSEETAGAGPSREAFARGIIHHFIARSHETVSVMRIPEPSSNSVHAPASPLHLPLTVPISQSAIEKAPPVLLLPRRQCWARPRQGGCWAHRISSSAIFPRPERLLLDLHTVGASSAWLRHFSP